jgi:type IV fimbrial biogenesis protein FimT
MHRHQSGLSLIESTAVTAVMALALGAALPSFDEARARRQLEGAAAQLETDLQLARAEAVARNEPVRVSVAHDETGSCYWLHTGAKPVPHCADRPDALRLVRLAGGTLRLHSASASMLFDPVKGTVTPTGTLKLGGRAGTVHVVVNVMGRVRSCSPDAALPGLARC